MMASSYNAKDEDGHITVSGPGGGSLRSKKPENTAFKQQRLPAWQPILTAGTVLPAFFIIGLIFIPIGIGLYVTSNNIKEFEVTLNDTEPEYAVILTRDRYKARWANAGSGLLRPKSIEKFRIFI